MRLTVGRSLAVITIHVVIIAGVFFSPTIFLESFEIFISIVRSIILADRDE